MSKRPLLVLDINGLFGIKSKVAPAKDSNSNHINLGYQYFYFRSGALDFVNDMAEQYDLAIFSSTTFPNIRKILEHLNCFKKFKFVFARDRCELDVEDMTLQNVSGYDTVKKLTAIWRSPEQNATLQYSSKNTLICDDEVKKVRFNDPSNYLIIKGFEVGEQEGYFDELTTLINLRFEELADSEEKLHY